MRKFSISLNKADEIKIKIKVKLIEELSNTIPLNLELFLVQGFSLTLRLTALSLRSISLILSILSRENTYFDVIWT